MPDKEELKAKLHAKLELSKISRLPKDAKEEKFERLKKKVADTLMKEAHGSPLDFSLQTSPS